jgi:hypothetical protein
VKLWLIGGLRHVFNLEILNRRCWKVYPKYIPRHGVRELMDIPDGVKLPKSSCKIAFHKTEKCAALTTTIFLFGNLHREPCHLHVIFFRDYYGCPLKARSHKKPEPNCVKTVSKTLHNWR